MAFSYLNRSYKPKKNDIIVEYRVEPSFGLSLERAAEKIAAESSIGTWTKLSTLNKRTFNRLSAKIFFVSKKTKRVKIAYPLVLFEPRSIPQLLSSIAGNIFSMKDIKNLRLEDIKFPDVYINKFSGPGFGIDGIRKIFGIYNKPILGSIIKPKVGLSAAEQALLAYKVFKNGIDIIKDDENLTDLPFDKFTERVKEVLKLKKKAEKETGKKKVYAFNVTGPLDIMLERAKFVKKEGGKCIMVDIVSCGWSALQYLRDQNFGLIIHGHRAGHSAFTRNKKHGLTMLVVAKLARLAGIDQLHTGTVVGKMEGTREEVLSIDNFLRKKWANLKPVMPIASGGLHPALLPKLIDILGRDLIINFGGGIHGHPQGSEAGAIAVCQAAKASLKRIPLNKFAKNHQELKSALSYWKN
ncbi:type III ribulose-bisphosphate carboxylase [bacterium]|nr:type III ribulose-bisphosphate carboxylase [bacterium]